MISIKQTVRSVRSQLKVSRRIHLQFVGIMINLKILVICVLVAATLAQPISLAEYYTTHGSSIMSVDNYINANRRQYAANIRSYDLQIQTFKDLYAERINTISVYKDLLIDFLLKTDEHLYPLELLSNQSKTCVDKYKSLIPSVAAAKFNMDKCMSNAKFYSDSLVQYPSSTNTTLQNYYLNTFEKSIQSCQWSYRTNLTEYSICAEKAVSAANIYTSNNQQTFATQLASSYSSANSYVKTALECSFAEQNRTISLTTQANGLIDNCLHGFDYCNSHTGHFCEDVYYMPSDMIDPTRGTMQNVFFGKKEPYQCLMISVS